MLVGGAQPGEVARAVSGVNQRQAVVELPVPADGIQVVAIRDLGAQGLAVVQRQSGPNGVPAPAQVLSLIHI